MTAPLPFEQHAVGLDWSGLDGMPLETATALVAGVIGPGEIFLAIGQSAPPLFIGELADQVRQMREIKSIRVRPITRVVFSPARVRELIGHLQAALLIEAQSAEAAATRAQVAATAASPPEAAPDTGQVAGSAT